mmetsp:Transcript_48569/g.104071  ORF Transcript_48569/g.104071 Transcript_48569/m.104071 type:complete len:295 (+) Transcript_48569:63-947(+)
MEEEGEVVEFSGQSEQDVGLIAEARKLLDEVQAHKQGRFLDEAIKVAMKAREAFKEIQDKTGEAEALMEMAESLDLKQAYAEALATADEAVVVSKESFDDEVEGSAHLLVAHVNVGALEYTVNSGGTDNIDMLHSQATNAGKLALDLARKSQNAPAQAQALYILSRAHLAAKREKEADRYAEQSYKIFKGDRIYDMAAAAKMTQAQVHNAIGKVEDAMGCAKEALSLAQRDPKNCAEMATQASEFLSAVYEASRPYVDDGQGGAREDTDWAVAYSGLAIAQCRRFHVPARNRVR